MVNRLDSLLPNLEILRSGLPEPSATVRAWCRTNLGSATGPWNMPASAWTSAPQVVQDYRASVLEWQAAYDEELARLPMAVQSDATRFFSGPWMTAAYLTWLFTNVMKPLMNADEVALAEKRELARDFYRLIFRTHELMLRYPSLPNATGRTNEMITLRDAINAYGGVDALQNLLGNR